MEKSPEDTNSPSALDMGKMIFFGDPDKEKERNNLFGVTHRFLEDGGEINTSASTIFNQTMALTFLGGSNSSDNQSANNIISSLGPMGDLLDTENDTMNILYPVRDPYYIVIPILCLYSLIFILGLLGNVMVCCVILRSRYLQTITNTYLFSLAISDLLLLLSGIPAEMHSIWQKYPYVFGEVFCVGRGLAAETSGNATVLTITAFTVERYLAICRPFVAQKWQNKISRVVRQLVVIWVISIALAVPQALQFGLTPMNVGPNMTMEGCGVKHVLIEHSFEIATLVFFVCPMILITVLYCLIGIELRNASRVKESKLRLRKSLSGHKREVGQQRVLKMLVCIVICFVITYLPFQVQRLVAIWGTKYLAQSEVLRTTYHVMTYISGVLYYLSTCINPILYSILSLKFRHAFMDNVNRCCGDKNQRKSRAEVLVTINHQRSLSHSSRSQNILLTELTTLSNITGNFIQPIHQHHPSAQHLSFSSSVKRQLRDDDVVEL